MLAVALGTIGLSYASVPLYRMFCQATGFGGTPKKHGGGGADEDAQSDYSKYSDDDDATRRSGNS